jgi:hypothetical protein
MKQILTRLAVAIAAGVAAALVVLTVTASLMVERAETEQEYPSAPPEPQVPRLTVPTTVEPTTTTTTEPPPVLSDPEPAPPSVEPKPEPVRESGALRPGESGAQVLALQHRLSELGYWLGTPDGSYGYLTSQAVLAFQKVEGLERDGIAGATTLAALEHADRPSGRSGSGDLVEVDKTRQVLLVIRDGEVNWVLNTSTGTEAPYEVGGRIELADTPPGRWSVAWAVDGMDWGELGGLYRPRYFHGDGIAVHGYHDVPAYPASHGCVRVTEAAMDWIWANDVLPMGSTVWVY